MKHLQWSNHTVGPMNWEQAKEYADSLKEGGFVNWRLPTVKELISLVNYDKADPASDKPLRSSAYWSYTVDVKDDDFAWSVGFEDGCVRGCYKPHGLYALCVRNVRGD